MTIQRVPSQKYIYDCPDDQIGQVYMYLDPKDVFAFAHTGRRMQEIFHNHLPSLIKEQFAHPISHSMPLQEHYLRLALAKQTPGGVLCERTLRGHTWLINRLKVNAEGSKALSSSWDNTLKLWNLNSGKCLKTMRGHEGWIKCLQTNAAWTQALSGSVDKTLKLWDLITGKCVKNLLGHESFVNCVQMSQDGKLAISGSRDGTIKMWDLITGECIKTLRGHEGPINCLRISTNERWAISGSQDATLKMWDLITGECIKTLRGHKNSIISLQMSEDESRVISGSPDNTMIVWDLETGTPIKTSQGYLPCMNKEGTRVLSGNGCALKTLVLQTVEHSTLQGHKAGISCIKMGNGGTWAISGSRDKTLKIWDLQKETCVKTLKGHRGSISCMQMNTDETRMLSGSSDQTLRVWNLAPLPEERIIALGQALLQKCFTKEEQLRQLPPFARKALSDVFTVVEQESKTSGQYTRDDQYSPRIKRIFNRYIAREFLTPLAKLFQDGVDSSFRRFALFPDDIQQAVYKSLGKSKGLETGEAESAFHNLSGYSATHVERAEALRNVARKARRIF